jgi:DNA-binding NtrC family response regulator
MAVILLVDDDPDLRVIMGRMLSALGYEYRLAPSAAEACDLMDTDVELLITDVTMPDVKGDDLAHQLQELWPMLKVLLITGYTAELRDYPTLHKPFDLDSFHTKIEEALRKP